MEYLFYPQISYSFWPHNSEIHSGHGALKMIEINGAYYPPLEQHSVESIFIVVTYIERAKNHSEISPVSPLIFTRGGKPKSAKVGHGFRRTLHLSRCCFETEQH